MFFFQSQENKELIKAIQFILGYNTKKPELFKLALLHKSIKSDESNERLEFLVSRDSLNDIGRKMGLKKLINVKKFKSKSYNSIYGDALEAIIGACYLEKGFDFCEKKVIKNIILPYFDLEKLTTQTHNFKSKILEWAQKEKISINFIVEKTSKSSRLSEFKSILKIDGKNVSTGYGKSKKNAEKDASRIACEKLELG